MTAPIRPARHLHLQLRGAPPPSTTARRTQCPDGPPQRATRAAARRTMWRPADRWPRAPRPPPPRAPSDSKGGALPPPFAPQPMHLLAAVLYRMTRRPALSKAARVPPGKGAALSFKWPPHTKRRGCVPGPSKKPVYCLRLGSATYTADKYAGDHRQLGSSEACAELRQREGWYRTIPSKKQGHFQKQWHFQANERLVRLCACAAQ